MGKQMRIEAAELYTRRTAVRSVSDLRNGTGEDMDRTQAEKLYECPLEQSTFTETPKR